MGRARTIVYVGLLGLLGVLAAGVLHNTSMFNATRIEAERYEAATAWPVLQARVEATRFREALSRHVAGDPAVAWDDVLLRFDIFWSRIPLLNTEAVLPIDLDGLTLEDVRARAGPVLEEIEWRFRPLTEARGRLDLLEAMERLMDPLEGDLQALLGGFQVKRHNLFERTRQGILALGRQHALTVGGFFFVACLLMGMSFTEARRARRAERRFRHFATSASDLLWETDEALRISFVSDREAQGFRPPGLPAGRTEAAFAVDAWDELSPAERDSPLWREHLRDLGAHRAFRDFRRDFASPSGEVVTWQVSGQPIFDTAGRFRGYRGVASDITASLEQESRIRYLAEHDPLTGVLNRFALQLGLTGLMAEAPHGSDLFALLMFDLDGFKTINDQLGHDVGDGLLSMIGQRVREGLPEAELIARTGGDEFAVAVTVETAEPGELAALAERLLDALDRPFLVGGRRVRVGACAGVAVFPRDGTTIETLMKAADLALYSAKKEGPGHARVFDRALAEASERRHQIERALAQAIVSDAFEVHYQPLVRLSDGETLAYEALARWSDPLLGQIPPSVFVPIAEETGLIDGLGRCILAKACRAAAGWQGALAGAAVSVNLSPAQFRGDVGAAVQAALDLAGLPASRLILEITETVLMQDSGATLQTLSALSAQGVELAIDDFGAGYTSLAYLRKFPVQKIKLDRSFVSDIEDSEDSRQIIEAMVKLAHVLGLSTVAEGVETEGQMRFLDSVGCDLVQGYLLGRPAPLGAIMARGLRDASGRMRGPAAPPAGIAVPTRLNGSVSAATADSE